jgi:hypothetical protein
LLKERKKYQQGETDQVKADNALVHPRKYPNNFRIFIPMQMLPE